jgi:hypothetical protein
MRPLILAFAVSALIAGAGCGPGPHPHDSHGPGDSGSGPHDVHGVWANSVFGSVDIKQTADLCAGRVKLEQGAATVNDNCFTGDTNVVLAGNGSDLINYARVR